MAGKIKLFDLDHPHRAEVLHDEVVLAPIPDEPPLVEISEPAKDLELAVDSDPLLIDVYANDDFGVSDIRLMFPTTGRNMKRNYLWIRWSGKISHGYS